MYACSNVNEDERIREISRMQPIISHVPVSITSCSVISFCLDFFNSLQNGNGLIKIRN